MTRLSVSTRTTSAFAVFLEFLLPRKGAHYSVVYICGFLVPNRDENRRKYGDDGFPPALELDKNPPRMPHLYNSLLCFINDDDDDD